MTDKNDFMNAVKAGQIQYHNADVNARDAQGRTALRIAREAKQESAARFLQEMGGIE